MKNMPLSPCFSAVLTFSAESSTPFTTNNRSRSVAFHIPLSRRRGVIRVRN
ncbi:unnamed protein product [Ixodes hexagonus]